MINMGKCLDLLFSDAKTAIFFTQICVSETNCLNFVSMPLIQSGNHKTA